MILVSDHHDSVVLVLDGTKLVSWLLSPMLDSRLHFPSINVPLAFPLAQVLRAQNVDGAGGCAALLSGSSCPCTSRQSTAVVNEPQLLADAVAAVRAEELLMPLHTGVRLSVLAALAADRCVRECETDALNVAHHNGFRACSQGILVGPVRERLCHIKAL